MAKAAAVPRPACIRKDQKICKGNFTVHVTEHLITSDQIKYHVTKYKTCCRCNQTKEDSDFYMQRTSRDGLGSCCRVCERMNHNTKTYGITKAQYWNQVEKQGLRCPICKLSFDETENREKFNCVCVDHCHVTGDGRGLLCINCNLGFGPIPDSTEMLRNGITYLEDHKERGTCVFMDLW